jgi:[ribosomal protein S5]-alanine N-acetyltransferase
MAGGAAPGREVVLETGRLLLRPELAVELLRRVWRQGYATEASLAVVDWARSSGYGRLGATVWDWNTASRRVLARAGFTETGRKEVDAVCGTTLFTTRRL